MNVELSDLTTASLRAIRDNESDALIVNVAATLIGRRSQPRYTGPVVVDLGWGSDGYAFNSNIPLAVGDTVEVDTQRGRQTGTVKSFGTGRWQPQVHGALRWVVKVIS